MRSADEEEIETWRLLDLAAQESPQILDRIETTRAIKEPSERKERAMLLLEAIWSVV